MSGAFDSEGYLKRQYERSSIEVPDSRRCYHCKWWFNGLNVESSSYSLDRRGYGVLENQAEGTCRRMPTAERTAHDDFCGEFERGKHKKERS